MQPELSMQKLQIGWGGLQLQVPLLAQMPPAALQAPASAWQSVIWQPPPSVKQMPLRQSEPVVHELQTPGLQLHDPSEAQMPPAARQAPASALQLPIWQTEVFVSQRPLMQSEFWLHDWQSGSATQLQEPSLLQ